MTSPTCPSCGSDRLTAWIEPFSKTAYAECTSCHARGPIVALDYTPVPGDEMTFAKQRAIEAWSLMISESRRTQTRPCIITSIDGALMNLEGEYSSDLVSTWVSYSYRREDVQVYITPHEPLDMDLPVFFSVCARFSGGGEVEFKAYRTSNGAIVGRVTGERRS